MARGHRMANAASTGSSSHDTQLVRLNPRAASSVLLRFPLVTISRATISRTIRATNV